MTITQLDKENKIHKKETPTYKWRDRRFVYEKVPPTVDQLILVERIKYIVSALLNNESALLDVQKEKEFIEKSLNILETRITLCTCDYTKTWVNELLRMNNQRLNELESKLSELEERDRIFKMNEIELKKQAITDGLTKLFNRREFDFQFETLVKNHNEEWKPFTLALLDLDNFKLCNDTHGHDYWNQVLIAISKYLLAQFSSENVSVFRIWWEELAILANDKIGEEYIAKYLNMTLKYLNENRIVSEREKTCIRNKRPLTDLIIHKQTFSAAVRYYDWNTQSTLVESDTYEDLDKVLYEVKDSGRNKVEFVTNQVEPVTVNKIELVTKIKKEKVLT